MLGENVVGMLRSMRVAVRTEQRSDALAAAVPAQIRSLDPSLPVTAVRTMEEVVQTSAAPQRFNTVLLAAFGLLALLLAALGIGGVLATSVSRRTQELGIRMALGAGSGTLLRMVVGEGMVLALIGLALGLPVAFCADAADVDAAVRGEPARAVDVRGGRRPVAHCSAPGVLYSRTACNRNRPDRRSAKGLPPNAEPTLSRTGPEQVRRAHVRRALLPAQCCHRLDVDRAPCRDDRCEQRGHCRLPAAAAKLTASVALTS